MPMSERAATALEKSIKHWEENVAAGKDQFAQVHIDGAHCSLCEAFFDDQAPEDERACLECPVFNKTGRPLCADTPWKNAHKALLNYRVRRESFETWQDAARAELEFLKSLRDAPVSGDSV